jgi:hypothetical protein
MSFTISEEEYKSIARELQLEGSESKFSIAHKRDVFRHIDEKNIRVTPSIGKSLFEDLKMKTFHISAVDRVDQMAGLVGVNQKKPLSSFTFMSKSQLRSMGGIQTEGGIIYELIGTALFQGTSDIMSIPDERFRRWLPYHYVIPSTLTNEYVEAISSFKKSNAKPSLSDENATIRYVALYSKVVENFVKQHKDEIKKFVTRERGSSYNEILIQQFEVKDVLITVNNVKSYGSSEYQWLSDYRQLNQMMDRRELNEPELRQWKEYHKMFKQLCEKLLSFAKGNITFTDDTSVALTWVKERGGMIDSAEYSKTFKEKELTENKTNKKMSKKIKISESQLKAIMERRHTYAGDTNEEEKFDIDQLEDKDKEKIKVAKPEEMKEQDFGMDSPETEVDEMAGGDDLSVRMAILSHLNDLFVGDPSSRKTRVDFIKVLVRKFVDKSINISEDKLDDLWEEVSSGDLSGNALNEPSPEESQRDMPGFEGTMDALDNLSIREDDDEMMNESIKNIKNNFKRFL